MSGNQWPFDMSTLEIGSFVSREQIAEALPDRPRPGTEDWSLTVLEMSTLISKEFMARVPSQHVTVKSSKAGLRILDDREAAKENARRARARRRGLRRDLRRALDVDVLKLPDNEREAHERHLIAETRKLASDVSTDRQIRLERSTPKPSLKSGDS